MSHDKNKRASGLKYSPSQDKSAAPSVVAKGFGELAEEIIQVAREEGILIHEDAALSETLATLDLGQEIPEALYYIIAELIAYSYVLQGKVPDSWKNQLPGLDEHV